MERALAEPLPEPAADAPAGPALAAQPAAIVAPSGRNWRDLRARVLSAALLVPVGLGCIWFGGWPFALLVLLTLVGVGTEAAGLLRHPWSSPRGLVLAAWPAVCCLAALLTGRWEQAVLVLAAPVLFGLPVLAGSLAIGLAGLALLWLRLMTGSGWDGVLMLVLAVIASDSLAYLTGRMLGGPKLAPRISPGKTWSGSLGGLAGAMLVGLALSLLLPAPAWAGPEARALRGLGVGLLLGLMAQAGDLAESALKRRSGVKDSGRLIPGHGGLLDRFDGLLAAAPLAALLSLGAPAGTGFWYVSF